MKPPLTARGKPETIVLVTNDLNMKIKSEAYNLISMDMKSLQSYLLQWKANKTINDQWIKKWSFMAQLWISWIQLVRAIVAGSVYPGT
jgi:predicted ribonuclease YlaK